MTFVDGRNLEHQFKQLKLLVYSRFFFEIGCAFYIPRDARFPCIFVWPNVRRNACCRIYVQSGQSFSLIFYNIYLQYFGAHLTNQWTNAVWLGVRGHSWEYRLKDSLRSGYSWMYQRTPMGNPYISPI